MNLVTKNLHARQFALRPFGGLRDLPGMLAASNASSAADGIASINTLESMTLSYRKRNGFDPEQEVVIAEADGIVIGFARGWWLQEVSGTFLYLHRGVVTPEWQRNGVGRALLKWVEQRLRSIAQQHDKSAEKLFNVFVTEPEVSRAFLLKEEGYQLARYFFSMRKGDLRDIAAFPVPTGIEIRPVESSHYRAIWDLDQEVFSSLWGRARAVEGAYEAWLRDLKFQPQLWKVAWDVAKNRIAGQARPYIDHSFNQQTGRLLGYTEDIAVRESWRRHGLAKALVSHSLQALASAGVLESALEVDSGSPYGATDLYQACGFEIQERNVVYRKPLC